MYQTRILSLFPLERMTITLPQPPPSCHLYLDDQTDQASIIASNRQSVAFYTNAIKIVPPYPLTFPPSSKLGLNNTHRYPTTTGVVSRAASKRTFLFKATGEPEFQTKVIIEKGNEMEIYGERWGLVYIASVEKMVVLCYLLQAPNSGVHMAISLNETWPFVNEFFFYRHA